MNINVPYHSSCSEGNPTVFQQSISAELYSVLVENSPLGILQTDLEGCISFASRAALALLDLNCSTMLLGTLLMDWVDSNDQPKVHHFLQELPDGREDCTRFCLRTHTGRHCLCDVRARVLHDHLGFSTGILLVLQEIDREGMVSRSLSCQHIDTSSPCGLGLAPRQAETEMFQRRLREMQLGKLIDHITITNDSVYPFLRSALPHIAEFFQAEIAEVLLYDEASDTLRQGAGVGYQSNIFPETLSAKHPVFCLARNARTPVALPDVRSFPGIADQPFCRQENIFSSYLTPLRSPQKFQGLLQLHYRRQTVLQQTDMDFLAALALQVAIAIEKTSLWEQLQSSLQAVVTAYDTTLEGWVYALDLRDNETEQHATRVTRLTEEVARKVGICEEELVHIRRGALLHDIGKIGIPDNILKKAGSLTAEEWVIMKQHPVLAYQMLRPIAFLWRSLDIPYCHHEHWDGSGYPRGLKGESIPLAARLFAVVDVWDALTSDRPYRKAWTKESALQYILSKKEIFFDPLAVDALLQVILQSPAKEARCDEES